MQQYTSGNTDGAADFHDIFPAPHSETVRLIGTIEVDPRTLIFLNPKFIMPGMGEEDVKCYILETLESFSTMSDDSVKKGPRRSARLLSKASTRRSMGVKPTPGLGSHRA